MVALPTIPNLSGNTVDLGNGQYATAVVGVDEDGTPIYLNEPQDVSVINPVVALGRLVYVAPFEIPGIAIADALDAGDVMGLPFSMAVPPAGAIVGALYHDLSYQGINKKLWVFNGDPTAGLAASDAAFSLTDPYNLLSAGPPITFTTWRTAVTSQLGQTFDLPWWYVAPLGRLWFQMQTDGTDTIAISSVPRLSFVIERYDLA